MPEGDVVWSTARRLREALAGQVLTRSDFRVPKFATVDLSGQLVTEVVARGKHLLIRTSSGLTVHTHLKMDGFWRVRAVRPGVRPVESFKLRLLLANAQWEAAGYLLAVTEVIPTAEEDRVIGHLGPDLLGPDWDPALAVRLLSRDPDRPIGEALLDQRNLAASATSIGRDAVPARHRPVAAGRLDRGPARPGRPRAPAARRQQGPARPRDHRRHQARQGDWVYGRAGKPCRRCGTRIEKGEQGPAGEERLRFWCPNCQL